MQSSAILVTGAFGQVGSDLVRFLAAEGRRVIATGRDHAANRKAAARWGFAVHWADLTRPAEVEAMLTQVAPAAIVHLAAVIPPRCYARRDYARAVNVGATATLVRCAEAAARPPRLVFASSLAVYGPRNPHRYGDPLREDTPVAPFDLYGAHKAEAEDIVRASTLDWVILRLGGVLSAELAAPTDLDGFYFGTAVPVDNRVQMIDFRDACRALTAATTADVAGQVLVVGGDDSHRVRSGDNAPTVAAALGLTGGFPPVGRPGDPDSDTDWFPADWADSSRAHRLLDFQHHTRADTLAAIAEGAGRRRHLLRVAAPLARRFIASRSVYHGRPGRYADPWSVIGERWGDPAPDR